MPPLRQPQQQDFAGVEVVLDHSAGSSRQNGGRLESVKPRPLLCLYSTGLEFCSVRAPAPTWLPGLQGLRLTEQGVPWGCVRRVAHTDTGGASNMKLSMVCETSATDSSRALCPHK